MMRRESVLLDVRETRIQERTCMQRTFERDERSCKTYKQVE
jgi:hypothetical protein